MNDYKINKFKENLEKEEIKKLATKCGYIYSREGILYAFRKKTFKKINPSELIKQMENKGFYLFHIDGDLANFFTLLVFRKIKESCPKK